MIDRARCMAPRDRRTLGGPRCQAPATHDTPFGRHCASCAEELRRVLRSPDTFCNVIDDRARTEEEVARLVVELPS